MIIVDPDKLEGVLLNEVGKHGASDLIVALEEAGALRTVQDTAVVTVEQAVQWADRPLTDGDIEWLKRAIPKSTVPEVIGDIAFSLTLPVDRDSDDATVMDGQDSRDSRQRYIVDCNYFPAMLNELYAVADDHEAAVLDNVAIRSGLIWVCDCGRRNPHWFDSCAVAH